MPTSAGTARVPVTGPAARQDDARRSGRHAARGRIGVWLSASVIPDDGTRRRELAAELDELGYGTLWTGGAPGDLRVAESLLEGSSRLAVATGIVNIWTDPAAAVAEAFHRVDAVHGERFLLGLGSSHAELVEPGTGQPYVKPLTRLLAYLDDLDAAPRPVPAGRRVLAALGPRTLAASAARSAGAHPYLVTPEHTRSAREIIGPEALLAPEQKVLLETDPGRAREIARATVGYYLALPNYVRTLLRLGFTEDDVAGAGSDRLIDALVAWGDEDAVLARVAEHHAAGADHVCIQPLAADRSLPASQLRRLAEAGGLTGTAPFGTMPG